MTFRMRYGYFRMVLVALMILPPVLAVSAYGDCPAPENGTVFVRAPLGNIVVDTTGTDQVQVEVTFSGIEIEEHCFDDHVEISGVDPERVYENVDWNLRVPPSLALNLVTLAGSIRIQNTEGAVTARTEGGSVTTGNIGGAADITTQGGGAIVTNDIGGSAELRSLGGEIRIGRVGGNAELNTAVGSITAGPVAGSVHAETAGGTISVEEAHGPLTALTEAGDVTIGTASGRVQIQTGGGNIEVSRVRGPFRALTDFGDVRIGRAESSIEATSLSGDVEAVLIPTSVESDLYVTLESAAGNTYLSIPENLPATLEATVDRYSGRQPQLLSDFRLQSARPSNLPDTLSPQFTIGRSVFVGEINGGGHSIHLKSTGGQVEIRSLPAQ